MNILDFPVTVINMENRTDRKAHITNLLNDIGFTNFRFQIPISLEKAKQAEFKYMTPPQGSLALTTYQILEEMKSVPYFFIMEDDIVPVININKIPTVMQDTFSTVNKLNFDLLYYEYCHENCYMSKKISSGIVKLNSPLCAACILYSSSGANKVLANIDLIKTSTQTDVFLRDLILSNKIIAYGNYIFEQDKNQFGSDLFNGHHTKCRLHIFPFILLTILVMILFCFIFIRKNYFYKIQ